MDRTFLFYDIESSGLSKPFDQVLQFAAIRTDLQFNELSRHSFYVQLSPDVLPDPVAMLIHKISWEQLAAGSPEHVAIRQIHGLLNTPGTISIGYNTLGFDDEFLRFSFYRNLLTPYTHQYANQCGRADLYPMIVLFHLYQSEALQWPVVAGRISMKLEHLAECNGIDIGQAHDAMCDVEATLALAKKILRNEEVWQYTLGYFNKHEEVRRIQKIPANVVVGEQTLKQALYVDGALGSGQAFQAPVLSLGQHKIYKNQTLWLRLDSGDLATTTEDSVATIPYVIRKKAAEPGFLLPMKARFLKQLSADRCVEVQKNLAWCQAHPKIIAAIAEYHKTYEYPVQPDCDVDAALYQVGFKSVQLEQLCQRFVGLPLATKVAMLSEFDGGLAEMARRIIWRQDAKALPQAQLEQLQPHIDSLNGQGAPLVDFKGDVRRQPQVVYQQINQLLGEHEQGGIKQFLLDWRRDLLRDYPILQGIEA